MPMLMLSYGYAYALVRRLRRRATAAPLNHLER